MKTIYSICLVALFAVLPAVSFADFNAAECGVASDLPQVRGVIRQIDRTNQKLRIKHEEIPNLGMPAMTMTFVASSPCMLDDFAVGEKIFFTADEVNGELTATWMKKRENE